MNLLRIIELARANKQIDGTLANEALVALADKVERLNNGLIAIETRTKESGPGTTAGEVYRIARNTRFPPPNKDQEDTAE